ncbi:MAG: CPBP family intramembrane glutamic endopeptidase [Longimonas sp.]|uniref:CPBP family intramembrane glutamic endopeptidase n=1 Tax=Longimonas sp. TaxID=2039626 RepID=UPI003975A185
MNDMIRSLLYASEASASGDSDAPAAGEPVSVKRQVYLAVEFVVLFVGLPLLLYTQRTELGGRVVPILLLLAVGCVGVLLLDPRFDRQRMWNAASVGAQLRSMLGVFALGVVGMIGIFAWRHPDLLWSFPREHTRTWLVLMITYPLLSVYPQELIFRTFLFHRYDPLFGGVRAKIAASGTAFGIAHIVFANWAAPLLTGLIGFWFARTYARSESTLTVTVEHILWGMLAFTVGLGWYFYSPAI